MNKLTEKQKQRLDIGVVAGTQRGIFYSTIIKEIKEENGKLPDEAIMDNIRHALKMIGNDEIISMAKTEEKRKKLITQILTEATK